MAGLRHGTARRRGCRTAARRWRRRQDVGRWRRRRSRLAVAAASRVVSHTEAARLRSCVDSTRPSPRCRCSVAQQLRDLQLVAGIERRRRLVEQQQRRPAAPGADAMTTRCFSPPLSVENSRVANAVSARRAPARRARWRGRRGFRPRTRPGAGSGPSARARARCSRRPDACSCGTIAMRRATALPRPSATIAPAVERHRSRRLAPARRPSSLSSVRLARTRSGPSTPMTCARADVERDVAHHGPARRRPAPAAR